MKKSRWWDLIIQLFAVAVGVYLGMVVSNKNEIRKERKERVEALGKIQSEINNNLKELKDKQKYHSGIRDTIIMVMRKVEEQTEYTPKDDELDFFKGIRPPRFNAAAYQSSLTSGVFKGIDFSLLESITSCYSRQDDYDEYITNSITSFSNVDFVDESPANFKRVGTFLLFVFNDLYYHNLELEELYKIADSAIAQELDQ